jgi:hypothetical protein
MSENKDNQTKAEMTEQSKSRPETRAAQPVAKDRTRKAPPTQDRWFDIQLGRMYSDLAAEPVPSEMMALINKLKGSSK